MIRIQHWRHIVGNKSHLKPQVPKNKWNLKDSAVYIGWRKNNLTDLSAVKHRVCSDFAPLYIYVFQYDQAVRYQMYEEYIETNYKFYSKL